MPKNQKIRREVQNNSKRLSERRWFKPVRLIVIIVVLAAILGVSGWSIYNFQIRPYKQTVMKVNDTNLDMRYFINMCKIYYGNAPADTTISDFADFVAQQIEQTWKVISGSQALGVQIPRNEIENELSRALIPISREKVDIAMAEKLIEKQVPPAQAQYNVQAMLLEDEAAAQAALSRLQAGEDFSTVSLELSKYPLGQVNPTNMGWVTPREADLALNSNVFGGIITGAAVGTLAGPSFDDNATKQIGYWVAKIVEKSYLSDNVTPGAAHINGVLLATMAEAQEILDKVNAGADINELAVQYSKMPGAEDNGADIGWVTERNDINLYGALIDKPIDTITGPITDNLTQTTGGYWVVNVLEKQDNMALTDDQQSLLQDDLFNKFSSATASDPKYQIKNLLTQEMKDFALNQVVLAQGKGSVLIASNKMPAGEAGLEYYFKIKIYGEQSGNTFTISAGTLPDGLSLDESKGVISGIPENGGGGGFTIKVENSIHFNTEEFSYQINVPITIHTTTLPDGKVGDEYSQLIEIFSSVQTNTFTIVKGSLPDGLTLGKATGTISGIPVAAGKFVFTVQADDGLAKTTQELTITIQ